VSVRDELAGALQTIGCGYQIHYDWSEVEYPEAADTVIRDMAERGWTFVQEGEAVVDGKVQRLVYDESEGCYYVFPTEDTDG
jgi:hypothetical protein